MRSFIFDVDGTLTPSRGRINKHFGAWFGEFCESNDVYLVTGSDRPKTIEQVGIGLYAKCKRVYQCSGNDVYEQDTLVHRAEVDWHKDVYKFLEDCLAEEDFSIATGNHIEQRPGMINYCLVGRNANTQERQAFMTWERDRGSRHRTAAAFNKAFPQYQASIAGETGIDIVLRGAHKGQIIEDFDFSDNVHFFGDKIDPGGNDYELALAVDERCGIVYDVSNWKDTWEYLKEINT
tara:strand:- start:5338 stop:6042 length:705 start_codon:yes stop_codon:yes gene_type:complete